MLFSLGLNLNDTNSSFYDRDNSRGEYIWSLVKNKMGLFRLKTMQDQ